MKPLSQTLLEKAAKGNGSDDCWIWTGARARRQNGDLGYGVIGRNHRLIFAHRVAWEVYRGVIPDGLFVLHRCDNVVCVNPAHLFLGTQLDNIADMLAKGRHLSRRRKERSCKGERHGGAKLTAADVIEIRALADKQSRGALAARFGVARGQIGRIIMRQRWAHI